MIRMCNNLNDLPLALRDPGGLDSVGRLRFG
jgi:hypothetical protein